MNSKRKAAPCGNGHQLNAEGTKFSVQLEQIFNSFYTKLQTMKECDVDTGVMRSNICWYCRTLRKSNQLFIVGKRLCRITKHRTNVYSTNPELAPKDDLQLNQWEEISHV